VPHDVWFVANVVACLLADGALIATAGTRALVYVLLSALAGFGPHVLGARRVSEHLTVRRGQPTNSYYGPLNRVSFDVGYHVEHHVGVGQYTGITNEFLEELRRDDGPDAGRGRFRRRAGTVGRRGQVETVR
jgi:fatty acid desaturase